MKKLSSALTIAGSDSGGGAGIQADLKTFAAISVHGTTAITCLTAQNPKKVSAIEAISPSMVRKQIEAVFGELRPDAIKTGMLFSNSIIDAVVKSLKHGKAIPLVVDPVMVSTSGALLLEKSAVDTVKKLLLPRANLVTPNLDEAQILVEERLTSVEDLRRAAKKIYKEFGCAALVKGGHLRESRDAVDIFYDGKTELLLTAPFVKGVSTHGTGCTYSAAIAAFLARGESLPGAVAKAKQFITKAIATSVRVKSHYVLNPQWT